MIIGAVEVEGKLHTVKFTCSKYPSPRNFLGFLGVFLLLSFPELHAQITLSGVVKDSLDVPLELANVVAINKQTGDLASYGITDAKGEFRLELKKNANYEVQVSYVGMKTLKDLVMVKESDLSVSYKLEPENALDEVELIYEIPVTVKGDTLIYNADSFKNGSERK